MTNLVSRLVCLMAMWTTATALTAEPADDSFSPEPLSRPKVLLDYYHRANERVAVGKYLLTGSYADTTGRYQTDDFSHTNSYDAFFNALEKEFALRIQRTAFAPGNLRGADIVVILSPTHPQVTPGVPVLSEEEIVALTEFVECGGSLLIMLNAGGRVNENFETVQLRKLVNRFGVDWENNDTHYSDIEIGPEHPYFYDMEVFHYGAGCTLKFLDGARNPEVMLKVYEDDGYDEPVRGPGLVRVRHGQGKVMVVGDTGSWGNGNMSRPWAENRRFVTQLFHYLKRDQGVGAPTYTVGKTLTYRVQCSELYVIPSVHPLATIAQPQFRYYEPRPRTRIPYTEVSGTLHLTCDEIGEEGLRKFSVRVQDLARFDEAVSLDSGEQASFQTSRQGHLFKMDASGALARWMSPDFGGLVGFIPNDSIRVGDRWQKVEQLRLHPVRGSDLAKTRPAEVEMLYLRDETLAGHDCRVIRTQTEMWLTDLGVTETDLLPAEHERKWGGTGFEFRNRGGKLLLKRDQWLDRTTGVVVKSYSQSRILVWMKRVGEPLGKTTIQKDGASLSSLAHVVTYTLAE